MKRYLSMAMFILMVVVTIFITYSLIELIKRGN